jgi:hypothetical protein
VRRLAYNRFLREPLPASGQRLSGTPNPQLIALANAARNPPNSLPALTVRGVEASPAALQTLTRDRPDVMALPAGAQALHGMHSRRHAPPGSREQVSQSHLAAVALQLLYQDAGDAATASRLERLLRPDRPRSKIPRRFSERDVEALAAAARAGNDSELAHLSGAPFATDLLRGGPVRRWS